MRRASFVAVLAVIFLAVNVGFGSTVAYWQFNENDGGQFTANSAGSETAKLKRGILSGEDASDPSWSADGILGSAWHYSPNTDYKNGTLGSHGGSFTQDDFAALNLATFTIEGFFKLDTLPGGFSGGLSPYYLVDYKDKNSYHNYALRIYSGNLQYFQQSSTGANESVTLGTAGTAAELAADTWYWFGVTRDNSTGAVELMLRDMVTGEMISTTGTTSTPASFDVYGGANPYFALSCEIGGGTFFQRTFDGLIDEVRISNDVLGAGDMLYNSVPEPATIGLLLVGSAVLIRKKR